MLLSRVDHKDPKQLAEEADALWTLHGQLAAVATMPVPTKLLSYTEDSKVAAPGDGINSKRQGGGS
jgi:hypothetical protein